MKLLFHMMQGRGIKQQHDLDSRSSEYHEAQKIYKRTLYLIENGPKSKSIFDTQEKSQLDRQVTYHIIIIKKMKRKVEEELI